MRFVELERFPFFTSQLDHIIKKYPLSEKSIKKALSTIISNPSSGDRMPGFGVINVCKLRHGLKEYRVGKSGGLRIIYAVFNNINGIIFISVYHKAEYRHEKDVLAFVRESLKKILTAF